MLLRAYNYTFFPTHTFEALLNRDVLSQINLKFDRVKKIVCEAH